MKWNRRALIYSVIIVVTLFSIATNPINLSYDFAQRLDPIYGFLKKYKRPFTIAEVGARTGDNACSIARDFKNSVVVALEGNRKKHAYADMLLDRCQQEHLPNIIVLGKFPELNDLKIMGECEHFDCVYSILIEKRFADQWKTFFELLRQLADNLIIEVNNRTTDIHEYLVARNGKLLAQFTNSDLWLYEGHKTTLSRKTWIRPLVSKLFIESTYDSKLLIKYPPKSHGVAQVTPWKSGINLVTFKMCSGTYPSLGILKKAVTDIKHVLHSDWNMHNMILQGDHIELIDFQDPRIAGKEHTHSKKRERKFNLLMQCLEISKPADVENFYWSEMKAHNHTKGDTHETENDYPDSLEPDFRFVS